MNRWATGFLIAAAVAVVVSVMIFAPSKTHRAKPVGSALFEFDPDDISLIKITNGDDVIEFRRTEDGWYLVPVLKSGSPEIAFVPEKLLESVPTEESSWLAP